MNKKIYNYNERKSDIKNKKRQKTNRKENDNDKNESEGIIHNEMNEYNERKVRRYEMEKGKKEENVWNKSNDEVERSEERNGEWN